MAHRKDPLDGMGWDGPRKPAEFHAVADAWWLMFELNFHYPFFLHPSDIVGSFAADILSLVAIVLFHSQKQCQFAL